MFLLVYWWWTTCISKNIRMLQISLIMICSITMSCILHNTPELRLYSDVDGVLIDVNIVSSAAIFRK